MITNFTKIIRVNIFRYGSVEIMTIYKLSTVSDDLDIEA